MNRPHVTIVVNYDSKSAIYIDGKLAWEERYLSVRKVLDKIAATGAITVEYKACTNESLNDVGQYPDTLDQIKFDQ
jgi:hypothetical protein